jgi:hypothetical protein
MSGYPWARLPPVEAIDVGVTDAELASLGAKSVRAFSTTEGVQIFLVVFEFPTQPDLSRAKDGAMKLFGGSSERAPYYVESTSTGAWLLVAGFPGSKPVSPQMQAALTDALSRWAGDE